MIKKKLTLLLALSTWVAHAQLELNIGKLDGSTPLEFVKSKDKDQSSEKVRLYKFDTGKNKLKAQDEGFDNLKKLVKDGNNSYALTAANDLFLTWEIDDNKVAFYLKPSDGSDIKTKTQILIHYCGKSFSTKQEDCKEEKEKVAKEGIYSDIPEVPVPIFEQKGETRVDSRRNRYLVIDASTDVKNKVNNTVYKRKEPKTFNPTESFDKIFEEASPHVRGTLSVFIKNFNQNNIEEIKVILNGNDFAFTQGLQDIFTSVTNAQKKLENNKDKTDDEIAQSTKTIVSERQKKRTEYLREAYKSISEGSALFNSYQLKLLQEYKNALLEVYNDKNLDISLDADGVSLLSKILSWLPKDLLLTPYSSEVPDTDEVEFIVQVKHKGKSEVDEHKIGTFRNTGGLSFNLSSNLYMTGLKNNNVYQETIDVNGTQETRARLEGGQRSLGIGMNGEVGFRTGGAVRPTFNVGFFIPFSEDISPYLAIGPGFSISSKKVKLTFSGGLAYGSVNRISEQYRDKDLSTLNLANDQITSKVWDSSWFLSIGINFLSLVNDKK